MQCSCCHGGHNMTTQYSLQDLNTLIPEIDWLYVWLVTENWESETFLTSNKYFCENGSNKANIFVFFRLELFKSDLKMKAKLINDMYTQKRQYENSKQEEQNKSKQSSAHISHLSSILKHYNVLVSQQKESLHNLRKDVLDHRLLSTEIVVSFGNEVRRVTERLAKKVEHDLVINFSPFDGNSPSSMG